MLSAKLVIDQILHYFHPPPLPSIMPMQNPPNDEQGIKTVDFSSFIDYSDKQRVSDAILSSLKSIGFVYITNHGIPEGTVKNMFKWVRIPFLANFQLIMVVISRSNFSPYRWRSNSSHLTQIQELITEVGNELHLHPYIHLTIMNLQDILRLV
jgi:hypothetical protein